MEYKVWKANMWSDDILEELIAIFYDLEKAKEFVYDRSFGGERYTVEERYVIVQNGKKIDID